MKVHEASSLYSEEKAKILRSVGGKIEEKDQQLNTYLASLKLEHMSLWDPDIQTTEWERLPLPDELVERCAALNAKQHVIQDLVDIMGKLSDTSQDVEKILKEIKKLLLDEELKLQSNYFEVNLTTFIINRQYNQCFLYFLQRKTISGYSRETTAVNSSDRFNQRS